MSRLGAPVTSGNIVMNIADTQGPVVSLTTDTDLESEDRRQLAVCLADTPSGVIPDTA